MSTATSSDLGEAAPSASPGRARARGAVDRLDVDFDVLVLAELNLDVIVHTGKSPMFGQVEQRVDGAAITLGSSGAITASALVALGLRVAICGTVGADRSGSLVLDMLSGFGVDTSAVEQLAGEATGLTVALTAPNGDRALMTYPGAMALSTTGAVPRNLLERSRHLHLSSVYLQTGLQPGLASWLAGRPAGMTVSVDPGWDPGESWCAVGDLLPVVDWFLPNENECLAIDGHPGSTVADAARRIAANGPSVVVKRGATGAMMVTDGEAHVRSVVGPVRQPVDTTGAGDNFDAGFLAAMLRGADPLTALAEGCACGAISIEGTGGTGRLASAVEAAAVAADILTHGGRDRSRPAAADSMNGPGPSPAEQELP